MDTRARAIACRDELLRFFKFPPSRLTVKDIALGAPTPPTIESIIEKHMADEIARQRGEAAKEAARTCNVVFGHFDVQCRDIEALIAERVDQWMRPIHLVTEVEDFEPHRSRR